MGLIKGAIAEGDCPHVCMLVDCEEVKVQVQWPAPLAIPSSLLLGEDGLGRQVEVPQEFICPITLCPMAQPAFLISENLPSISTYDKDALEQALAMRRVDPRTNITLQRYWLSPNHQLRARIEDWLQQHFFRSRQQQQQQQQHHCHLQQQPQQQQGTSAGPTLPPLRSVRGSRDHLSVLGGSKELLNRHRRGVSASEEIAPLISPTSMPAPPAPLTPLPAPSTVSLPVPTGSLGTCMPHRRLSRNTLTSKNLGASSSAQGPDHPSHARSSSCATAAMAPPSSASPAVGTSSSSAASASASISLHIADQASTSSAPLSLSAAKEPSPRSRLPLAWLLGDRPASRSDSSSNKGKGIAGGLPGVEVMQHRMWTEADAQAELALFGHVFWGALALLGLLVLAVAVARSRGLLTGVHGGGR